MKLCWFNDRRLGLVQDGGIVDITSLFSQLPAAADPFSMSDYLIENLEIIKAGVAQLDAGQSITPLEAVTLLSPVLRPSKIIGAPVNYHDHISEAKNATAVFKQYEGGIEDQGLFLKASSSLVGAGEGIEIHFPNRPTHHEIELAVIIGKPGKNIPREQAFDYVAGYAIALDMTLRGNEDRSFRKSIDTYSVLGPWLTTADEIPTPQALDFSLEVNGELRQRSNSSDMIMKIDQQIAWASTIYTLYPGDVIMTGTSAGVGPVYPGDIIIAKMQHMGEMTVKVR